MKQADVQIGGRYWAKVSGRTVTVRVTAAGPTGGGFRQRFQAVNEATGREITVTAARLRGMTTSGLRNSGAPANPDGGGGPTPPETPSGRATGDLIAKDNVSEISETTGPGPANPCLVGKNSPKDPS